MTLHSTPLSVPLLNQSEPLDFVTVTFSAELRLLQLQARSFARYLPKDLVGTINIIVNEEEPGATAAMIRKFILPLYGLHVDKVRVWSRDEIVGHHRFIHSGWYSQQVLKLQISQLLTATAYIILDTKNHFIRDVSRGDFVAEDGRLKHRQRNLRRPRRRWLPRWWPRTATKNLPKRFVGTFEYFGLDPMKNGFEVVPKTTPFPVYRAFANRLIAHVESSEQSTFSQWFETYFNATEFYLLQAFPASFGLQYCEYYDRARSGVMAIYPDKARVIGNLDKQLKKLDNLKYYCFGVHRASAKCLSYTARSLLVDFWRARELVALGEKTDYFFDQGAPLRLHEDVNVPRGKAVP